LLVGANKMQRMVQVSSALVIARRGEATPEQLGLLMAGVKNELAA
jgi:hypothetical protein